MSTPDNMEQKAMDWYLRRMNMENEPPDIIEAAKTIDHVKANVEMLAAFARSLAPLPLSMTDEWMEEQSHKWANAEPPWEGPVERTYARTVFKEGLRYASTHTKTITVERTFTLSEVTAYADDLMTAHLDPGRVVDREKDEQGADWIHRARNHVNAKHGVSPDSA